MSEVREWLDDVRPGYGDRFGPGLDDEGVDSLRDLADLASTDLKQLDDILLDAGAKRAHLTNIHKRIASLTVSSDPNSQGAPPEAPSTQGAPPEGASAADILMSAAGETPTNVCMRQDCVKTKKSAYVQTRMPIVQALVCMCFVLTCACAATCSQDTGGTCLFFCDASRNAACVGGKCVCTGGACSDGSGVCVSGPTSAPTSQAPTPAPTAYNGVCHDATVPNAAGGADWSADATMAIFYHYTCKRVNDGYLGAVTTQKVVDSIKMIPIKFVQSQGKALTSSDPDAVEGSTFLTIALAIIPVLQLKTNCMNDGMVNTQQAAALSVTPTSAVQACCVCGGGSGSTRARDPAIIAALRDFYRSTGGETWVDSYGVCRVLPNCR